MIPHDLDYFNFYYYDQQIKDLANIPDYVVTTGPGSNYPVDLTIMKSHLRVDYDTDDALIQLYMRVAEQMGEQIARHIFTQKSFRTYVDWFEGPYIQIKRGPLVTLDSFQYLTDEDGTYEDVPSDDYYVTSNQNYWRIYIKPSAVWPSKITSRKQGVKIEFTAGFSVADTNMPEDIKLAIMHHVSVLYEQRGDWGAADATTANVIGALPSASQLIYAMYAQKGMNR